MLSTSTILVLYDMYIYQYMMDVFLNILQFISVLITGILGITNLLVDYKDKNGNITKGGKRALIGIVASSLISVITFGIDLHKKKQEEIASNNRTLESVQRTEKIITNLNRSLNPIRDVTVTFSFNVYLDGLSELKSYKERLANGVNKLLLPQKNKYFEGHKDGISVHEHNTADNTITGLEISEHSSLYPQLDKEPFAHVLFNQNKYGNISFYKKTIPLNKFPGFGPEMKDFTAIRNEIQPDLQMTFIASEDDTKIYYYPETDKVEIWEYSVKCDPKLWQANGNIIAIPDLANAQMFLEFDGYGTSLEPEGKDATLPIKLSHLQIHMTDGRKLLLQAENLKRHKRTWRKNIYIYNYPNNIDSLLMNRH